MAPAAPGWFTISTCWPQCRLMPSAMMRRPTSTALPGEESEMIRTGPLGYSLAAAGRVMTAATRPKTTTNHRRCAFMFPLPEGRSARLDACGLDDRPPLVDLGLLEFGQIFRRLLVARRQLVALLDELLADVGIGQRMDHARIEPGDNVLRRAFRRKDRLPRLHVDAGGAAFVRRRDVRRVRS